MTEALRLEGLHKSFGRNEVLRGIGLAVDEHEVVCLIGASGSGKSTLLRCVTLIEPIDPGRLVVAGLLFVLLAVPSARLADSVSARARRRQQAGGLL